MSWKKEVSEIGIRKKAAKAQGGEKAIEVHHQKGRLTLRERIELLIDKNTFDELGELAGGVEKDKDGNFETMTPANFILGFGKVNNRQVIIGGEDFTVKGGSPNSAGLRKSVYTEDLAIQYKVPLVRLHEGGGGSVAGPKQSSDADPVFSKSRFKSVADSLRTVPVASAALGPVAGLPASRFVASHFRVMTKSTSQILVAGPAVVSRAFGKNFTKEELGGSEIHKSNGVTDNVAENEEDALNQIKTFLSFFPQNIYELAPHQKTNDPVERISKSLLEIIPKERNKSYEMREILKAVFDKNSFFEMTNFYGRGIITGFARLNGYSFGVFANDSNFYAGSMTADNAKKTSRFVKLCETFHIPIITFVDEPGFLIGPEAEKQATILYGTEAVLSVSETTVPWATVLVRKAFGVAAAAHFAPNPYVLSWPSSESGALPLEGGVAIAFAKEIANAKNPEEKRKEIENELAKKQNPFSRAESFSVHEIIDPSETRQYLCKWIERVQPQLKARLIN
jgi:acetyl-CoA carboxylase carboxyltransferase component|tara:strand:- start:8919 stop:10445 length:1527 start_codon:yes stop_codon:yes gene_type:complete